MSEHEIAVSLEVAPEVVSLALRAVGGSGAIRAAERASEDDETDDVTEAEAREMMGVIKDIARSEESGVFARLNAAKYVHGAKRGYHKRHLDLNLGSGELLLKINDAYASAAMRARQALGGVSLTAKEVSVSDIPPVEPQATPSPTDPQQITPPQPAAPKPRPFNM